MSEEQPKRRKRKWKRKQKQANKKHDPILRVGACCAPVYYLPRGLIHVFLHAPSAIKETRFGYSRYPDSFCLAAMHHRDQYYPWMRLDYRVPKKSILSWIESTPLVSEWVRSNSSFRAPRLWPPPVVAAFGKTPLPAPVDFANIDWREHWSVLEDHNTAVLQAYACGVNIPRLRQMLQTTEVQIHSQLVQAVRTLLAYATFKLWCVPVDWRFMVIPEGLGEGILEQGQMAATLRKDPFGAPLWAAEVVVNTLAFGAYASSNVPREILKNREVRAPPFLVAPA